MPERCSLPGTSRLLDGGRRRHAGEPARLAEVIAALLARAADPGPRLRGIGIKRLLVNGDQATLLDALIQVRDTRLRYSYCVQRILRGGVSVHYSGVMFN